MFSLCLDIAHGFIADMVMSKEDFDHLLFDDPISATMEQSFGVPMTVVETNLAPLCLESNDSGFSDDQTMMSTDTEFESVPASPSMSSSTFLSNSPSSESGIEEDDEGDDIKLENFEFSQALNTCPQVSVADAYEELKQLLYTVATVSQTSCTSTPIMSSLSTLPTNTVDTKCVTSMINMPYSTRAGCPNIQPAVQNNSVTAVSSTNSVKLPSMYPATTRANSNLKCVRRKRKLRDRPKLVILDEPEEVIQYHYCTLDPGPITTPIAYCMV